MSHIHNINDGDAHFVIDPATRTIKNGSGKSAIVQNDHKRVKVNSQTVLW
ncbi:MAG: hypothetical protein PUB20_01025 [Clostridia bacterium]|nr:hypothetical protein [Clostridia bacterium]